MKILFITENSNYDYLRDSIFIGLVNNGHDVTDSNYLWMLGPLSDGEALNTWCKGFTYGNVLNGDRALISRTNIEERIKEHYYDIVIYGSVRRCFDYYDMVKAHYSRWEIVFLDGEDDQRIDFSLVREGAYFKRELSVDTSFVLPISFSIPACKLCYEDVEKVNEEAYINPYDRSTYIYTKEQDYYNDYRSSVFAYTCRKGGWDCLRHYEITGNKCIPYFMDYDGKPPYTMTNWPSDLQAEANSLYRAWDDDMNYHWDRIYKLINAFFNYTRENLTCEKVAEYMLNRL